MLAVDITLRGLIAFLYLSVCCQAQLVERWLKARALGDMCAVTTQRTALVGSRLYFMTGNYIAVEADGGGTSSRQPYLYWLELNQTFPVDRNISIDRLESSRVPSNITPRLQDQLSNEGGVFLTNDEMLYLFAGMNPLSLVGDNILTAYNTSSDVWSSVSVAGGSFQSGNRWASLHASVPESGLSFLAGGDVDVVIPGMLRIDLSDPDNLRWVNETRGNGSLGASVPSVQFGEMVYLPMGKAGVLLAFGGSDTSHVESHPSVGWKWDDISMDQISIYDIDSATWYQFKATGARTDDGIPSRRGEFCTSVSRAPDDSSFQITMYGGWSLFQGRAFEEVWILTIPSFQWIQVSPSSLAGTTNEASNTTSGRYRHKCVTWNDSQMIVLGGIRHLGRQRLSSCAEDFPPIRALDMSTYSWMSELPLNSQYSIPSVVSDVIGGNSSGNARVREPIGGWKDNKLSEIFSRTIARGNRSRASSSPSSTSSLPADPLPSDQPKPSSTVPRGRITGGVVGGVVSLILIAGLLIILWRRKKASRAHVQRQGWLKPELPGDSNLVTPAPSEPTSHDATTHLPQDQLSNQYMCELSSDTTPWKFSGRHAQSELSGDHGASELPGDYSDIRGNDAFRKAARRI